MNFRSITSAVMITAVTAGSLVSTAVIANAEDGTLAVNYKCEGVQIKETSLISASIGEEVLYSFPKYIVSDDNTILYEAESNEYTLGHILSSTSDTVDVIYTAKNEGAYYLREADGTYKNKNASNGSAYLGQANTVLTVPESGEYRIAVQCYANAEGKTTSINIAASNAVRVGGKDGVSVSSSEDGSKFVYENVMLTKDSTVAVPSKRQAAVDYILAERTGDYCPRNTAECVASYEEDEGASVWTATIKNDTEYTLTQAEAVSKTIEELGSREGYARGPLSVQLSPEASAYVVVYVNRKKEDLADVIITLK